MGIPYFDVRTVTISSGGTVSSPFEYGSPVTMAVIVPNSLNTSSLFVQAGFSAASASTFSRIHNKGSDSVWGVAAGNGDFSKDLDEIGQGFPFVRFELSAAPGADQHFVVFTKT